MDSSRREFLAASGVIAATVFNSQLSEAFAEDRVSAPSALGALTKHELPKLSYPYDALEPYLDARTMELHHSVHHLAYVNGLNRAEEELGKARRSGDFSLVEYWSKKAAFHGGGHALHTLFWEVMAPAGKGGSPSEQLKSALVRDFGSIDAFQSQFSAAATNIEGSGWAVLYLRPSDGRLLVLQLENQHKLAPVGYLPILALDVWEHAYYLKYQNKRSDYVKAWWNVLNWNAVSDKLKALT